MKNLQSVVGIHKGEDDGFIIFSNGFTLKTHHEQECCESHYWYLMDLSIDDFDGLLFDLTDENFFERVEGYGIKLLPENGFPISIPAYGYNNGYYSSDLNLILSFKREYDISECQSIED